MVTRISTVGNYSAILANLLDAQQRQIAAGERVATQKNGQDLKDYAKNAEMLTAMRSIQVRLGAYQEQNQILADKLSTQDQGLSQVADAAAGIRQTLLDAIASGRGDSLMQDLQGHLRDAAEGMNTRYGGKYLFSGGQIDTRPMTALSLADLTAGPPISSFFQNDSFQVQAKLDDSTTVTTGVLASDIGTDLLNGLKTIQSFDEGGSGPFSGELTAAQKTFLEGQVANWDQVQKNLVNLAGRNGMVQKRVDSVKTELNTRYDSISGMMAGVTDADMAKAASDLQMAQISVQAAAQVFNSLQQSSLLNFLQP